MSRRNFVPNHTELLFIVQEHQRAWFMNDVYITLQMLCPGKIIEKVWWESESFNYPYFNFRCLYVHSSSNPEPYKIFSYKAILYITYWKLELELLRRCMNWVHNATFITSRFSGRGLYCILHMNDYEPGSLWSPKMFLIWCYIHPIFLKKLISIPGMKRFYMVLVWGCCV